MTLAAQDVALKSVGQLVLLGQDYELGVASRQAVDSAAVEAQRAISELRSRSEALGEDGIESVRAAIDDWEETANTIVALATSDEATDASMMLVEALVPLAETLAGDLTIERNQRAEAVDDAGKSVGRLAQIAGFLTAFLLPLGAMLAYRQSLRCQLEVAEAHLDARLEAERASVGRKTSSSPTSRTSCELRSPPYTDSPKCCLKKASSTRKWQTTWWVSSTVNLPNWRVWWRTCWLRPTMRTSWLQSQLPCPPTEEGPRAGVVVVSTALWQPPPTSNEAILAEVPRAVVTAFNSGILSLPELKFPLLLLAIALLLGLTFGRISVLPFGAIRRYEEGWVQAYDEAHEVGTVIPDGGASEVFVHGRSLEKMESLAPGQRVRFVAAETRGRRLALRAWPTTTP